MDGGIDNVDDLFVPINVNNIHWLFLHVDFREKAIRLYNSLGSNTPGHRKYLHSMRKYLYDEEIKGTLVNNRPAFAVWKQDWIHKIRVVTPPSNKTTMTGGIHSSLNIHDQFFRPVAGYVAFSISIWDGKPNTRRRSQERPKMHSSGYY